ncbi:hypothetical protein Cni_G25069 [Canna indica]|uniref:SANT domain-containing protein n=1 Tax=Canna indica TaxID=4628 RepID=A0AAQ3KZG1_9LILI|nr:hypothetical protein Cni_G25069 [Canna indica]
MPPEPLPWDRKEYLFKDHRKHERGDALDGGGGSSSAPRWRDPYHGPRDLPRASPRRPLSGHYRHGGGYHQVQPEDSVGHGWTPSRSDRLWFEDDGFRSSSVRYGGGHRGSSGGSSRDNRGSFRRSPYWDSGDFSRQHHHDSHVTPQMSVTNPILSTSQTSLKDQNGKTGSGADDGFDTGHIFDRREDSLGSMPWKKWSRPASATLTRTGRSESQEAGPETILSTGKENPLRTSVTSDLPPDDVASKKKPRLGWGQGLAKYEKQKVEGSQDASFGSGKGLLSDSSQKNTGISGCLSPATPCSTTCSSSPGTDDKSFSKVTTDGNGISRNSELPGPTFLQLCEEVPNNFDHLEVIPFGSLDSLLADMFQSEDAFSGDSSFTSHSAMSKLSEFKDCISNGLEKIETEIDLLEKELKSLDCDAKSGPSQRFLKLKADSVAVILPLAGLSNKSSYTDDQKVAYVKVEVVENAPCTKCFEEEDLIEDINITKIETIPSKINEMPDSAMELSDVKLDRSSLLAENERLEVSELKQIVDTNNAEKLMVSSEDDKINCVNESNNSVNVNSDGIGQSEMESNLINLIMDSNREAAKLASKTFEEVLPRNPPQLDIWGLVDLTSCRKNNLKIKEKLAVRKSQLKFKERVLTLKFRALHYLWKEDLHLLSIKKLRTKSGKRIELNRSLQSNSQKQRSSVRYWYSLPAGNFTLVPTTEIVNFTSKLLLDSQIKFYRNNLKMPSLLLDEKEKRYTGFITHNGLIEDPPRFEKERAMINPWSHDEKEVFMEMLAQVGKDFTKISSFLSHKTTADCIEFYYKNHKSESFKEVKNRLVLRKQQQCAPANTFLVASGKIWNHEVNAASLDMLGAASFAATHSLDTVSSQKYAGRTAYESYGYPGRPSSANISIEERETAAADMLVGICGALSSEALSSCISSSVDPPDKTNYVKLGQMITPEVSGNLDEEDACSDEGCGELDSADWTDQEKSMFIKALSIYGKDFMKISTFMKTRSREQCKIFFSKARKCLCLDAIQHDTANEGMPLSDANEGRSGTDDACVVEIDSAICSTQSCSKVDLDVTQSIANTSYDEIANVVTGQNETNLVNEQNEDVFIESKVEGTDNKEAFSIPDDKLQSQVDGNLQSDLHMKGSVVAADCEVADSAGRETKVIRTSKIIVSPSELVVEEACSKRESKMIQNAETDGDGGIAEGLKKEDTKSLPVVKVGLSNAKLSNMNLTANQNSSLCSEKEFNPSEAALLSGKKADVCHPLAFVPSFQQQMHLDLLTHRPKKHQSILLNQEDSHSVPSNSFFVDSSSICFGGSLDESSRATLNFQEHANKQNHNTVKRDLYQQYMLRNIPVNQVDRNIQILRGYPLQAFNQEVKREADCPSDEKSSLLETDSKKNGITQSNNFFMSDMPWKKSNVSNLSHTISDLSCRSSAENQSDNEVKPFVKKACSETEEHRTGDVKLFGKILSHPSSVQKSSSSSHESNVRHPSPKFEVSTTRSNTNVNDSSRFIGNAGSSGQVGLDERPVRTYGFWDGKRIQTGFSSLPENATMLAKTQEPLASLSFYQAKKDGIPNCSGVLTDYHQSYMQQLSSDGKRLESFSELQKRNGAEMVSGFQQQGRGYPLDANVMGGGILVGSGVSDPVAALKLHYAAARAKILGSDVESWRGDIGGR